LGGKPNHLHPERCLRRPSFALAEIKTEAAGVATPYDRPQHALGHGLDKDGRGSLVGLWSCATTACGLSFSWTGQVLGRDRRGTSGRRVFGHSERKWEARPRAQAHRPRKDRWFFECHPLRPKAPLLDRWRIKLDQAGAGADLGQRGAAGVDARRNAPISGTHPSPRPRTMSRPPIRCPTSRNTAPPRHAAGLFWGRSCQRKVDGRRQCRICSRSSDGRRRGSASPNQASVK